MDITGDQFLMLVCSAGVLFILLVVPLMQRSLDQKFGVHTKNGRRIKRDGTQSSRPRVRSKCKSN